MQKIDNIEIKNFKSIRHQKIEGCKRVNVFIGYPNVGKSNILEAIGLYSFAQFYNDENFTLESICRFNHLSDLNFDKNIKNEVRIGFNKTYELYFKKGSFKEVDDDYDSGLEDYIFEIGILSANKKVPVLLRIIANKKLNSKQITPAEKPDANNDIIYKIKYYSFDKNAEYKKIKSLSLSIPSGDNLLDVLQGNSDLRQEYAQLLKDYNLKLNISDEDISVLKELNDGTYVTLKHNLVSDTLRRLFFFKAAIQTNRNSVLLFEEPEAHMFPPYISKFTSDIMYDENDNQFFITTHSPFVINDFMENLKKDDYSIYTVGYSKETGETLVRRMTDDELHEIYQYGVDLFLNLENYLPQENNIHEQQ